MTSRKLLLAAGLLCAMPSVTMAQDVVVMRRVVAQPAFTYTWKTADGACTGTNQRAVTASCRRGSTGNGPVVADSMCTSTRPTTRVDATCTGAPEVVNGDFEAGLDGWTTSSGSNASLSVEVQGGSKKAVVRSASAWDGVGLQQYLTVKPGDSITISYEVALLPGANPGGIQPSVRNADSGAVIAYTTPDITSTSTVQRTLPFTVPAGVTKVLLYIGGWSNGPRDGTKPTAYTIDNIKAR